MHPGLSAGIRRKKWPLPEFVKEWPDFIEDFQTGKVKKKKIKGGNSRSSIRRSLDYLPYQTPILPGM